MNTELKNHLSRLLPVGEKDLEKILGAANINKVSSKTILLSEGEKATRLFLVIRGCLRTYFIKENGTEITSQFFMENQMVSSFESVMTGRPSRAYIDAIEDSTIGIIPIKSLEKIIVESGPVREYFDGYLMTRLLYYMNQHASFILDSPEKRYVRLIKENPELVSRLPQQYIASYLGITPVSLSRIRARIKKQINNG